MFSVFFKAGKKQHAFQRVIVILLITLCFVDLAVIDVFVPELCEREVAIISVAKAAEAISIENSDGAKNLTYATNSKHPDSSSPSAVDEDCFCCCSHILPSSYFSFPLLSIQPQKVGSITAFYPTSPPLKMYRPPRIA